MSYRIALAEEAHTILKIQFKPRAVEMTNYVLGKQSNKKLETVQLSNNTIKNYINPLNPELNSICYLLALLGAPHFLHVSRIRVKLLTLRLLMSHMYGAPILDVSRSHTTTQRQSVGLLWTSDQLVAETST